MYPDEIVSQLADSASQSRSCPFELVINISAFDALWHNPVVGRFYNRMVARGKTFKQAMTACMRKLLVLMICWWPFVRSGTRPKRPDFPSRTPAWSGRQEVLARRLVAATIGPKDAAFSRS
jgi:hypothetical protein